MNDVNLTTGKPVTEQAPTPAPVSLIPGARPAPLSYDVIDIPEPPSLPENYLADGFLAPTANGKSYLRPEYVGEYALRIAQALPPLKAAAFSSAFVKDAKRNLKSNTPYEAQATVVAEMRLQAIKLVAKNKAPVFLREFITAATSAVVDRQTFEALYRHLDAVYAYLLEQEGPANEPK